MKRFILALALFLLPSVAFAQCNGIFSANTVCGKVTSPGTPGPVPSSAFTHVFSVSDYGAVADCTTDNTVAFQNAVNAVTAGGTVSIPGSCYNISGTISVTKPMTLSCSPFLNNSTGNINANGTANLLLDVNTNYFTLSGCVINRAGAPSGDAIHVGDDFQTKADGVPVAGNTTFTSATANFNCALINAANPLYAIFIIGAVNGNPLVTTIASCTNSTTVVLTAAPSGSVTNPATFRWGNNYSNFTMNNVTLLNHATGVLLQDIGRYTISGSRIQTTSPIVVNNQVGQGFGASAIFGTDIFSTGSTGGVVTLNAGADVSFTSNKYLGGQYAFNMNWNQSQEGNLLIANSSMENYTVAAININNAAAFDRISIVGNSAAGTGSGAFIQIANTSVPPTNIAIVGNVTKYTGFSGTCMSIGEAQEVAITGNTCDFGGTGTGIAILSNALGVNIASNVLNVASGTKITNASSTSTISEMTGIAFVNLPVSPANGSEVFVTDGAPGSSPCTGSSTGATAFRQNGAWVCAGPPTGGTGIQISSAGVVALTAARQTNPTGQTFLTGSGTYTTPANTLWIEIELLGGGGGGAGSGTTPGAAGAGGNTCWNTSGAACTSPVYQAGGGALGGTGGSPSTGGTVSGSSTCNMALSGGNGQAGSGSVNVPGGSGGVSKFGGQGWAGGPGQAGTAAATNSGSGGGGAGDSGTANTGSGGAAGAYCRVLLGAPAGTYTYAVGGAGTAGTGGGSGFAGAAGGAGGIWVREHYN